MADSFVVEWHSRDLDATMIQREVDAVEQWKRSNATIHIMRDHPEHGWQILAGMFGMKQDTAKSKNDALSEFKSMVMDNLTVVWDRGNDQHVLTKFVIPRAKNEALVHDSYLCNNSNLIQGAITLPFPTERMMKENVKRQEPNFVGNLGDAGIEYVCPIECRPPDHKDWTFC